MGSDATMLNQGTNADPQIKQKTFHINNAKKPPLTRRLLCVIDHILISIPLNTHHSVKIYPSHP